MSYGTEVKLLAVTTVEQETHIFGIPDGEALIEYAGRLCYNLQDKLGTKEGWIQERIKDGHESILEHASATFYIKASRVLTHELVRHRIASYSQRSQRYVDESEPRYITPPFDIPKVPNHPEYPNSETAKAWFQEVIERCWQRYRDLLTIGVPREIARYILPNACETQIVMTMNFRELRHFIKLRSSKRALPEMREVAGKVRDICKEIAPQVFADIGGKENVF